MNNENKKKYIKIERIATILLVLVFVCSFASETFGAAPFTNIEVCVGPPEPDLINPNRPKINFKVSRSPFYNYQITITSASTNYDTGIKSLTLPAPFPPGNYSYEVPPGTLPIDNSTYNYAVRVKDAYDWSPYAQGSFVLGNIDGKCAQNLSFCAPDTLNTKPSSELCIIGMPNIINNDNPWSWKCDGFFGGQSSPLCCATALTPSQSQCGSVLGGTICQGESLTSSSPNLCVADNTATNFHGDGSADNPWKWDCTNNDPCHTPTAPCSKTYDVKQTGQCGSLDGNNFCQSGTPSSNLCSPESSFNNGSLENNYTEWVWTCGSTVCGGTISSCRAGNTRSCGWIETN
ncbi:MAG: hypothetical protein WC726_00550 [Parcubacteria group bacterium]|jgi:hypothetical protein